MGAERLIRALALIVLVLAGCAGEAGDEAGGGDSGRVASIADGDTLRLEDGRRVRLVGVDAPEAVGECWGREAALALRALTPPGSAVGLERDPALDDRDRFGRLLRYVSVDGQVVNVALVQRGAAAPYFYRGERGRHSAALVTAALDARSERRGLWGACPGAELDPRRALAAGPSR